MIHFITGGERSGKSRYAQQLALQLSNTPTYVATARRWDVDFETRIARHQAERDDKWQNKEEEKFISQAGGENLVVVVDCVTLWLTNIFSDNKNDVPASLDFAKSEIDNIAKKGGTWIIISNEIGMGVHAHNEIGRKFVELQGWVNQHIAQLANEATFMVSGIPVKIK